MNAEMQQYYDRLVRLMREGIQTWPGHGVMLIMQAERQVILEDSEAIAIWAETQEHKGMRKRS